MGLFRPHYTAVRYSTTTPGLVTGNDDVTRIDRMPSYRGAIVYKPKMNGSIYFDYGTSFNPSAEALNLIVNARGFGASATRPSRTREEPDFRDRHQVTA